MYPVLFSIGKVNFYTHGLMIALGCLVGGLITFLLAKKEQRSRKFLFDLAIYSLFVGLIGARITYTILFHNQFSSFEEILLVWNGGLTSFGGILFGFLFAWYYLSRKRANVKLWFDISIPGFFIGWAIGRLGCYFAGDILGLKSNNLMSISGRYPIALFESIWSIIVGLGLLAIFLYFPKVRQKLAQGRWFWLGIILYLIGRFAIDFYRFDAIFWLHLKAGQIVSLGALVLIIIYIYVTRRR